MQMYNSEIILNSKNITKPSKALHVLILPMFKMLYVVQLLQWSRPQLKKAAEILLIHWNATILQHTSTRKKQAKKSRYFLTMQGAFIL